MIARFKILLILLLIISNCQSQTLSDSVIASINSQGKFIWKTPTQVRSLLNLANLYQPIGSYLTAANFIAGTNYLAPNSNGSALTGITQSQVTGLTSSIAAKQDALVSNTNIKTINGASVLGSGDLVVNGTGLGYTLDVQALTSSPTDGQTIYFGQLPKAPVTAASTSKVYIRKAGTIKIANIYCYSGTAGTSEAWVVSIRLNNTTDTQIASVSLGASERVFSNTNLSIAVAVGDYIEIKAVNPTWSTNPLTTIWGGYIYIE